MLFEVSRGPHEARKTTARMAVERIEISVLFFIVESVYFIFAKIRKLIENNKNIGVEIFRPLHNNCDKKTTADTSTYQQK